MLPTDSLPSSAPIVLDLFCCAGGAALGYARAGFRVVGIDISPQPNYPFAFLQMDALLALRMLHEGATLAFYEYVTNPFGALIEVEHRIRLEDIAFIHASPPCQASTALTKGTNTVVSPAKAAAHVDLIAPTRALLESAEDRHDVPWVIENVVGAALRHDLTLCGLHFYDSHGLRVFRHRHFEFSDPSLAPTFAHLSHAGHRVSGWRHGRFHEGDMVAVYGDGGGKQPERWPEAMGLTKSVARAWAGHGPTTRLEIAESIPPAYAEFIGRHLLDSGALAR